MIVKSHAVSVQWGNGHHYFLTTELTSEEEATEMAVKHAARLKLNYKKGAKPAVHVWSRILAVKHGDKA